MLFQELFGGVDVDLLFGEYFTPESSECLGLVLSGVFSAVAVVSSPCAQEVGSAACYLCGDCTIFAKRFGEMR